MNYFKDTSAEQKLRDERFRLLDLSDWTQVADAPLTDSKKNEWQTYRQALRDLPANSKPKKDKNYVLTSVDWPTPPEK